MNKKELDKVLEQKLTKKQIMAIVDEVWDELPEKSMTFWIETNGGADNQQFSNGCKLALKLVLDKVMMGDK